jgi:hypothetical protein
MATSRPVEGRRAVSTGTTPPPYLASAEDIQQWADSVVEARTQFPRLIRRLIAQTNDQVTSLQMRADKGTGVPGYDGIVEASRATPFVPAGRSVWELGTGGDPADKATRDYTKRTRRPLGEDRSSTTFVFVTSRRWPEGEKWARRRRIKGVWRDVKVVDVDDIELALETAPAVHFWISELLGKPVAGIETIESWWSRFSTCTNPTLTPELVLAGRADQAAALLRILDQDCQITTIASASTDDVLAFVAAVLLTTPEETRADLVARTLIVRDALSLRRLEATSGLLVLLPFEDELRREAQWVANHHVIFLAYEDGPADIQLLPIDYEVFKSELEKLGVERERAHNLTAAARGSLVAFQHQAARKSAPVPIWQTQLESRVVRRAWLAGGWNERRTGDQDVLSGLLGTPYDEAVDELRTAAEGANPLFTVVGDTWGVSSIAASWPYARRRLTANDLTALEAAIQTVLGAVDPALELPVEDRWKASIYGKARVHSADLRRGLAETIAFLAALGDEARLSGGATASTWAEAATSQLLRRAQDDDSAQLWSSLADILPLLAEAAPDAFLTAVENGLTGPKPLLAKLFIDQSDALSVNSPHTGLIWALEGVAWSDEHAGFALRLLARLAEVDPGGRLSNRPFNSLANILKPWLPRTPLSANRRLGFLDDLAERHEAIAWRLMIELLPEAPAIGFETHAPKFRTWKPAEEPRITPPAEYWPFIDSLVERLLRLVGNDPERWKQLIEQLPNLSPSQREKVRNRLSEALNTTPSAFSPDGRRLVWEALDTLVRQHRTYADTPGALPGDELDMLTEISQRLKPVEPVEQHRWLFNEHVPDLGEGRRADAADYPELLLRARAEAVAEIVSSQGLSGVIELASECELPWSLGFALADAGPDMDEDQIVLLLDNSEPKLVDFARGYATRRLKMGGGE